ncbi:MAG: hypothetical protein GTN69_10530 [Armatimonadetes bacterium]|nr:hypothetical protein [Armatimonadota bacterium]
MIDYHDRAKVRRWAAAVLADNDADPMHRLIALELQRLWLAQRERRLGNLPAIAARSTGETRKQALRLIKAHCDDGVPETNSTREHHAQEKDGHRAK